MIKEAIILTGGMGTMLHDALAAFPKCMATVAGRPFLFYIINFLRSEGIEKFIFCMGHSHEMIEKYLHENFSTLSFQYIVEKEPTGTGGAIQLALNKATEKNIVIVNGDTLFKVNLHEAAHFHTHNNAECTMLLKPMQNFDRYGTIELTKDLLINSFKKKQFYSEGTINSGLYILNVSKFLDEDFPAKFLFEKDYLEALYKERRIYGLVQDHYFADISISEDFERAQKELSSPLLNLESIDKSWTLFLDRDGVINEDKIGGYILTPDEFHFMKGVPELFKKLSEKFGRIIIVTNQKGIGRGLMSEEDLAAIHNKMIEAVNAAGGKIDGIYYAPSVIDTDPLRKPNPGMAFRAKTDFPSIDFSKSIIVGNKQSDMLFGKNAGMYTVFIATTNPEVPFPHPNIDLRFDLLKNFAEAL